MLVRLEGHDWGTRVRFSLEESDLREFGIVTAEDLFRRGDELQQWARERALKMVADGRAESGQAASK